MNVRRVAGPSLSAAELYALLRVRSEVFVVEQDCAYLDLDGLDLLPTTEHFFILDAATVIATLRVVSGAGPQGETRIGRVCTARTSRGGGYGALLMESVCQAHSSSPLYLESQTHAAGFYARYGFAAIGQEFVEDGIPHIPMVREPGTYHALRK